MFMNKIRLHLGTQLKKAEVSGLRESLKEQSTMIAILKRRVEGERCGVVGNARWICFIVSL
jgi:hypothetical protein